MKKIKILSLVLVLLMCVPMLLIGCGEEEVSYKIPDIMNAEWKMDTDGVITSFKDASFVGEFVKANQNFVVTREDAKAPTDAGAETNNGTVVRVYNAALGHAVATLNSSKTTDTSVDPAVTTIKENYVHLISSKYFAVITTSTKSVSSNINTSKYFGCPLSSNYEYTLRIRDESGAIVETYQNNELKNLCAENMTYFDSVYAGSSEYGIDSKDTIIYEYKESTSYFGDDVDIDGGFDLFAIGSKVYRLDANYKATLVKDYGLVSMPNFAKMNKVGDNYLETNDSVYTVYDKDLNKVFAYTVPGYARGSAYLLANGNLLVQYLTQLDQNDKKFDIREGADGKYELTVVIVNKDGVTEIEDVDYVIGSVKPSVADQEGKKIYADSVENLAFIYPISDNKMLDTSYANKKLVLLSNDGIVTAEVETEGNIEDFPIQYRNTFYAVALADDSFNIYDKSGELRGNLSSNAVYASVVDGSYLRIGNVIYDAEGTVAYDIGKEHAAFDYCGDTLIISKFNEKSTQYGIFVNGEIKNIGAVSADEAVATIDDFGFDESGYYYTYSKADKKYTYYNSNGATIGTFDNKLTACLYGDDFIILQDTTAKVYYRFEITK